MGLFDFFKKKEIIMPYFEELDSQEKLIECAKKGVLFPMYVMPLRFNGSNSIDNILFVPKFAVELKNKADDMVENLLRQEKVSSYSCMPEYKGDSFVPSKVVIEATMKDEPVFKETIEIW